MKIILILLAIIPFCFVGFIFLAGGLFSYYAMNIPESRSIETEATIVSIDREEKDYMAEYDEIKASTNGNRFDVIVSYEVDGDIRENELDAYSSKFYEGMVIDIEYDKTNPDEIRYTGLNWIPMLFIGIGTVIIFVNVIIVVHQIINEIRSKNPKKMETTRVVTSEMIKDVFDNLDSPTLKSDDVIKYK